MAVDFETVLESDTVKATKQKLIGLYDIFSVSKHNIWLFTQHVKS